MYLSEPAASTALGRDVHLELPFIHSVTINKLPLCAQHCSREGNQGKEASKAKIPTLTHFTFLWEEMGFPGSSVPKESACSAGDLDFNPRLGRSPGGGHGNPL